MYAYHPEHIDTFSFRRESALSRYSRMAYFFPLGILVPAGQVFPQRLRGPPRAPMYTGQAPSPPRGKSSEPPQLIMGKQP